MEFQEMQSFVPWWRMREKYTLYQEEKNENYFQMLEMLTLLGSARNFSNNIPNRFYSHQKQQ